MSAADTLKDDLQYITNAVRRGEDDRGYAPLYFLWAGLIAVGFALPDFAPGLAVGIALLVAGICAARAR